MAIMRFHNELFSVLCLVVFPHVASVDYRDNKIELDIHHQQRLRRKLQQLDPLTRIEVINTVTDVVIDNLSNNLVINLSQYELTSPRQLNFNAVVASSNVTSTQVKSVRFGLDNNTNFRTENSAAFAACGNNGANFLECSSLTLGIHTLSATPWSGLSATGTAGPALTFSFTITRPGVAPTSPVSAPSPPTVPVPSSPAIPAPSPAIPAPSSPAVPAPSSPAVPVPSSPAVPVTAPTATSPAMAPVAVSPTTPTPNCSIPKFVGNWENFRSYPLAVSESHGSLVRDELVIFSGYHDGYSNVTRQCFGLNLSNAITNSWVEKDFYPFPPGMTHVSLANAGEVVYMCGGYVGSGHGPAIANCYMFNSSAPPSKQWTNITSLPEPRAGAAMFYDKLTNSLTYATGASRPYPERQWFTVDHNQTWHLQLSNMEAGWITKGTTPFQANHIGKATVTYRGVERHFMLGGQRGGDEVFGNVDFMYELNIATHTWIQRQSMLFPRGHFTESSVPYKDCGFLIVGGSVNQVPGGSGVIRTKDISYYDIGNNTWTYIGNFTNEVPTPVCHIFGGYLYCATGPLRRSFSVRRKIE